MNCNQNKTAASRAADTPQTLPSFPDVDGSGQPVSPDIADTPQTLPSYPECALERELKEGDFQVIDIEGLQFKRHFCFVSAQGQESDTVLNFMRFVRHFLSGK